MEKQHILIVTFPAQGHINPAKQLANFLLRSTNATITLSTAVSAHRRMFSSTEEFSEGEITYIPYSDGYDEGFNSRADSQSDYYSSVKTNGYKTMSNIVESLAYRGRPVTLLIYTFLLSWACEVARHRGIPSALYWIQPATVFVIYYHYFHGYADTIASKAHDPFSVVELPGLPSFRVRELPSFVTVTSPDDPYARVLAMLRELYEVLSSSNGQTVLVNTFDELEASALKAIDNLKLVAIGPVVSLDTKSSTRDLFKADEKAYLEWLDSKPDNSVVYVSFGSLISFNKQQMEVIQGALKESGKPYLWVVRKDNRKELGIDVTENSDNCMIVEWCSQVRVLSHPAVGCFVTHCGWNSTLESLVCGVPTVGVPMWTDQATNAWLMEERGIGVRGELETRELVQCLNIVTGEEEKAVEMRRKASVWKKKAREAIEEGGSSCENLKAFLEEITP